MTVHKRVPNCVFLAIFYFFSHLTLDGFVVLYDEFEVNLNFVFVMYTILIVQVRHL